MANFQDQETGTQLGQSVDGDFQFVSPAFDIKWEYGGDVTLNEATVDGVLGPLDRGLRILPMPLPTGIIFPAPEQVVPPPGTDEVRIRVGTPAEILDYRHGNFNLVDSPFSVLGSSLIITSFRYVAGGGRETDVPAPKVISVEDVEGLEILNSVSLRALRPPMLVVQMELFGPTTNPPGAQLDVQLFDSDGVAIPGSNRTVSPGLTTVQLEYDDAAEVVLTSSANATFVLQHIYVRSLIQALVTTSGDGNDVVSAIEEDGLVTVKGTNLGPIYVGNSTGGEFLILEIEIPSRKDDVIRHTIAALAQFSQEGPVLEPETNYRLTIGTIREAIPVSGDTKGVKAKTPFKEQVYFRTAGLPGIGVPALPVGTQAPPAGPDNPAPVATTGFEDVSFYVKRTIPAVPPPAGGHQTPARAVYRAYDQNVEFSEETPYVELMYRLGRRDLSLRLFDANNQPLRGTDGRVILSGSHWRPSEDPAISSAAARWIQQVNAVSCAPSPNFDAAQALGSEVVSAPNEEAILPPETLHQARLVPVLLHEAFVNARSPLHATGQGFQLDRWRAEQFTTDASDWHTDSETVTVTNPPGSDPPTTSVTTYFVTEETHIESVLVYDGPLASVNNTGHKDHPSQWNDLRASVQIRWQQGKVGFEVRRTSGNQLIRVTLDRDAGTRELVLVFGGQTTVLASDTPASFPTPETDVVLTVECVGDRVLVFQDIVGAPPAGAIFDVSSVPEFKGTVALYSFGAVGLHFTEILANDLREDPSTAFRFDFITSKYANFFHHLESADNQLFDAPDDGGLSASALAAQLGVAVSVPAGGGPAAASAAVGDAESRAFDALEDATLKSAKLITPERVEILRASHANATGALLVRSPEPIDWSRSQLVASTATASVALGVPSEVKLCAVTISSDPSLESVALLVRSPVNLAGLGIDWRPLPDSTTPDPDWRRYFTFANDDAVGDGREILVFSGAEETAVSHVVGTVQRFVATSAMTAAAVFPSAGVELRLVAPDGTVKHQRQFQGTFAPFDAAVIRKPDGTAFFLFPAGGGALPSGAKTLRLSFVFARNAGTGFPLLSQAGSQDPESAIIEVSLE